ncbi:MAG: GNAT family N-acetyltransferase [Nitrosarchaeum sp.]
MVVDTDNSVKDKLKKTTFSEEFIRPCSNSEFIAIEEENSKWLGICFVGGLLHATGIEILKEARGRGLSNKLLAHVLEECKKRKISFLTGVFKPTNLVSIKIHTAIGYKPIFNFYYNKQVGEEIIVILPFNKKGDLLYNMLRVFNTRIGNALFAIILILFRPFLRSITAFEGEEMPKINFKECIKNFKKI